MRKIAIIGSPGAGKSTLARKLGEILNIEVIHLDRYFWEEGWKKEKSVRTRGKWEKQQKEFIQKDAWIIDGSYHTTLNVRLYAADTVIFLDMPLLLCLWRVLKRHFSWSPRLDLPPRCHDRINWAFIKKVWNFPRIDRQTIIKKCRTREPGKIYTGFVPGKRFRSFCEKFTRNKCSLGGKYNPVLKGRSQQAKELPLLLHVLY